MPIDLTPAGVARPYPRKPRLLPWLGIWIACNVFGAAAALLLWPKGVPAQGTRFWVCVIGIPNLVYLFLLGIRRAGFEAQWLLASYWNRVRIKWLVAAVKRGQRPLQVLGTGYCLPLGPHDLAAVIAADKPLMKAQPPRRGSGLPIHNRFDDASMTVVQPDDEGDPWGDAMSATPPAPPEQVPTIILKIAAALAPLASSLHAVAQYGPAYAPVVRVTAQLGHAALREQQVREALRRAGLPALECAPVPAEQGLMVADTWLDSGERRPLLVIAVDWQDDAPPENCTEGCIAVLLNTGFYHLPESVRVAGILHRPVEGSADALGDLFRMALLWGRAKASAVTRTWITALDSEYDRALLPAWKAASLEQLAKAEAQCRPDRIIGHAASLNPWVSVAAAISCGASGPQLIMDRAQAALLHVTPCPNDNADQ
ncbi:hypothetical protein [Cupriavidus pinatubonensis]|uniref:hypothetical protein n=1 Tax=Cupriavidus pinatubonensis TaxID=248026 RepID=UPI003609AD8C